MPQKLFIGNIPYDLNERDLRSIFEEGGFNVGEVKIVTDRFTGRSKGFGFVSFDNNEDAMEAINKLNGKQVGGRTIRVAKAKRKEDKDKFRRGGDRRRSRNRRDKYNKPASKNDAGMDDESGY